MRNLQQRSKKEKRRRKLLKIPRKMLGKQRVASKHEPTMNDQNVSTICLITPRCINEEKNRISKARVNQETT